MKVFAQITKVDVEKREVWGRAVQEVPDKSREIFDYETSAPLFRAWSSEFEKATDGKSLGNIRAMHGAVAAGKVIALTCDDAAKAIDIGTKIVDDAEWQKVVEGVYTGFSIGGQYEKKWKDPEDATLTRYTAKPSEISIVDNPCVPTAMFSMVKADGAVEQVPFKHAEPAAEEKPADAPPADAPPAEGAPAAEPELDVAAIDPATLKAFLLERRAELDAAIAKAAAPAPATAVTKSIYSLSTLADALCSIRFLTEDAQWEADYEKDGSTIPAQLRAWLATGAEILNAMTAEETAEMMAAVNAKVDEPLLLGAKADLEKATSRNAALQEAADEALSKAAELQKTIDTLTAEKSALEQKVTALEAQPTAPKGVVKVVDKTDDTKDPAAPETELLDPNDPQFSLKVMKAVHQRPVAIAR